MYGMWYKIHFARIIKVLKFINWQILHQAVLKMTNRKSCHLCERIVSIPLLKSAKHCCIYEYSIENRPLKTTRNDKIDNICISNK
jgi:hypothetical protein